MDWQSEVLRFQEGVRSQHAPPEATFEPAPPGTLEDAGRGLAILVDLSPSLPHRSREIRVIIAESYWASEGSVVARLRRALAKANRYLANANAQSPSDQRASGSITCAAFADEEIFLGQVGPANALLYHPEGGVEAFPRDDRPLLPLGAQRPPVIHISYADVLPGSTLFLASTPIAESANLGTWTAALAQPELLRSVGEIQAWVEEKQITGSAVLIHLPRPGAAVTPPKRSPLERFRWRKPSKKRAERGAVRSETKVDQEKVAEPEEKPETAVEVTERAPAPSVPEREPREATSEADVEEPQNESRIKWPRLQMPDLKLPHLEWPKLRRKRTKRKLQLPEISFKPLVEALLPGKVSGSTRRKRRRVPEERPVLMGGLTAGFLLLVILITLTAYFDMGGESGVQEKLQAANAALARARDTQSLDDWRQVQELAQQVQGLDSGNAEAQMLLETADAALDAMESAAILEGTPLLQLGSSPKPRRVLVKQQWAYILNPATDQVIGLPLKENGITPASNAITPILKQGDAVNTTNVGHLVDLAWLEPRAGYPDGALLIYSDDGYLYVYEPSIGPSSIERQPLEGPMQPGDVTLVDTYAGQFYLVDRQNNQIWKYMPVHGVYDAPPRPYFPPQQAPALQNALAMALDGRLYLLMGNGSIHTYFNGTEDLSFRFQNLPTTPYHPRVMAIEPAPDAGNIYLVDPEHESIVVVDKRGTYLHQFRLPKRDLRTLEALAVSMEPHILYFVAENQLFATPIPTFASP